VDDKRFWDIIAHACPHDAKADWYANLHALLVQLSPKEIVHFDWLFNAKTAAAYTVDLWGAAYLINGGASDDGFYHFRCWLVGMGKKVYEAALNDPDSLADILSPDERFCEAGIGSAGLNAWHEVTGEPDTATPDSAWLGPWPQENLKGKDWDYEDDEEVRSRLPRLAALYLPDEVQDE
jgi:hypothetical protein